jgi:ferrous iron transport protein A
LGPAPAVIASSILTLDRLRPHRAATVRSVGLVGAASDPERARQLVEVGFREGETVMVVARAWPGHDPLVVRVGGSRFALRRAEAACIALEPLP